MKENRYQDLAEAFNSIISMMLATLRARGLRGLFELPKTILLAIYLRRLGREFTALLAAFNAGTLPLPATKPVPVPADPQPECAHPAEPVAAECPPQGPRVSPAMPAKPAGAGSARPAATTRPVAAAPATPGDGLKPIHRGCLMRSVP